MKFAHYAFAMAVAMLLALSGCITITQEAGQKFYADGSSDLTLRDYTAYSSQVDDLMAKAIKSYYANQALTGADYDAASAAEMQTIINVMISGTGSYFRDGGYAQWQCDQATGVESCVVEDGHAVMKAKLAPGQFYAYSDRMDWMNFESVKTYEISQVPLNSYYYSQNKTVTDTAKTMMKSMFSYLKSYSNKNIADPALRLKIGLAFGMITTDSMFDTSNLPPEFKAFYDRFKFETVDNVIDFNRGVAGGTTYENNYRMSSFSFPDDALPPFEHTITYTAEFPQTPSSVTINGKNVTLTDGKLVLNVDDMYKYGPGKIVVKIAKPVSPIGAWTWVVLVAVLVILLLVLSRGRKSRQAQAYNEPATGVYDTPAPQWEEPAAEAPEAEERPARKPAARKTAKK